jgi:hypothetical protein
MRASTRPRGRRSGEDESRERGTRPSVRSLSCAMRNARVQRVPASSITFNPIGGQRGCGDAWFELLRCPTWRRSTRKRTWLILGFRCCSSSLASAPVASMETPASGAKRHPACLPARETDRVGFEPERGLIARLDSNSGRSHVGLNPPRASPPPASVPRSPSTASRSLGPAGGCDPSARERCRQWRARSRASRHRSPSPVDRGR